MNPRAELPMPESQSKKDNPRPAAKPSRITFFVGKGGVGKTTVSAAYALQAAHGSPRVSVILVSSDPAHSLADVLAAKLPASPKKLPGAFPNLTVWQIDANREFRRFLAANRTALLKSLAKGTLFTAAELNSFLDATFPGMAEIGALLALDRLMRGRRHFSQIVVDTAPFGHTLRLLQIPGELKKLLELIELSENRDRVLAQSFGGRLDAPPGGIVARLQTTVEGIQRALSPESAELVLVTTPENFSLREAQRVAKEFKDNPVPMSFRRIVLNRAVKNGKECGTCKTYARKTQYALRFLSAHFAGTTPILGEDFGTPPIGPNALLAFGRHVFKGTKLVLPRQTADLKKPRLLPADWPSHSNQITFTTGKGGVGKTTTSAATSVCARQRVPANTVIVCSTDPAPSLDDVFGIKVGRQPRGIPGDPKLMAVETDSVALLRAWTQNLAGSLDRFSGSERGGVHVELSFERDFLRALLDLVPPGVDEIFATFEILHLLDAPNRQLVIDMAPTGHALELLRTPERLLHWSRLLLKALSGHSQLGMAQEVAVALADVSQKSRRLLHLMNDPARSQIFVVTLAEPLPDSETRRLLEQLQQLSLQPAAMFVNRVLLHPTANCRRCQGAAASQYRVLNEFKRKIKGVSLYVLPEMAGEPVGRSGLARLASRICRLE